MLQFQNWFHHNNLRCMPENLILSNQIITLCKKKIMNNKVYNK